MSDVETKALSTEENPFQPPAAPPEPTPPKGPPLAAYEGRVLEWWDARRKVELFEERLVVWTTLPSGATYWIETPLGAFRREPDPVWRRSCLFPSQLSFAATAILFCIPLSGYAGPFSSLGCNLACLVALLGLWSAVENFGPLLLPKAEGVSFAARDGGELLSFVESTPGDPEFPSFVQKVQERIDLAPPPGPPLGVDGPFRSPRPREAEPDPNPPLVVYLEPRAPWSGVQEWRLFADRVDVVAQEGWYFGGELRIDLARLVPQPERTVAPDADRLGWARLVAHAAVAVWLALLCGATWNELGLPWYERPWFFLSAGVPMVLLWLFQRLGRWIVPHRRCIRFCYKNGAPAMILFRSPARDANVDAFADAVSRQAEACRAKAAGA